MDNEMDVYTKTEIRDFSDLEKSFLQSESIIKREYLNNLTKYQVKPLEENLDKRNISEYIRFFDISKLVYNKDENFLEKITTICRSAHICNYSIASIIIGDGITNRFILGMINKNYEADNTSMLGNSLKSSVEGNFHGSEINVISNDEAKIILECFEKNNVVSSISNVASLRDEDAKMENYIQGIEKLVDSLEGKKYTIVTIADSVSNNECLVVKDSLEQLYSQLSGFAKTEMSMNENTTFSSSEQTSKSLSKAIGTNTSVSQSHTNQTGWSSSDTTGEGTSSNLGAVAVAVAGVAAVGLTVATGGLAAVAAGTALSTAATIGGIGAGAITTAGSVAGGMIGTKSENTSHSDSESGSMSDTETKVKGENVTNTESDSKATTISKNIGTGRTLSFSVQNRSVKSVLDNIDLQLERLKECNSYGSFSASTYVLSETIDVNVQASSIFNALISGEKSNVQDSKVNTWGIDDSDTEKCRVNRIINYLQKCTHPLFQNDVMNFTPASLVSGKELAIQLGLPKKSINGLSVVYKVPFGRNVMRMNEIETPMAIGNIYNLGIKEKRDVSLDLDSLTSHLFVTGSTGTGKSNTIYKLLEKIENTNSNVKFMVVEPAKGEYKQAFFKHPSIDVNVYGTNSKKTKLLKIDPFSFPDDVHVLEHIDRLVEILNVCWPMYAAMPAILKNAIIKSYESCGWDIYNSEYMCENICFPSFQDVLFNINEILESSAFSSDNKGDYTGALCTRVESLTYGITGQLFSGKELSNKQLFDENVIVDLSRVGAVETKSLIMGILVMKLQEYRATQELSANQGLRHIMVLEEAHNLLKKTSTEQSAESSNLTGKSVEMISNAIAEMRTYGESFFIVDQAPAMLDMSVIRNTNTKIVLRLPEKSDREIVGKAMALSDEQIDELAKLEKGCAVVYQNDWEEAVLCMFEQFHKDYKHVERDDEIFVYTDAEKIKSKSLCKVELLKYLLSRIVKSEHIYTPEEKARLEENVNLCAFPFQYKQYLLRLIDKGVPSEIKEISNCVSRLYDNCSLAKGEMAKSIDEWNEMIIENIDPLIKNLDKCYSSVFIQCLIYEQTNVDPEFTEYAEKWVTYMKETEVK